MITNNSIKKYTNEEKYNLAMTARSHAYAPYSHFQVGAVIFFEDGSYHFGCNIENASYGLSMCAERNAIFSAINDGLDVTKVTELVCIADSPNPTAPCGACRQVMCEFFKPTTKITLFNVDKKMIEFTLEEILPYSFTPSDLTK